jgi:SAM-dependent methyltransferase
MTQSVTFDRAAGYYDATRGYPPGVDDVVARLIVEAGGLNASSHIAEVGIGTGRVALPIASKVKHITGIDLSRRMMEQLRAKQHGEPIALIEGDITHLPLRAGSFDGVMASHIFHLVPGWQAALTEVQRVLKPGAALIHIWQRDSDIFRPLWNAWQEVNGGRTDETYGADWRRNPTFIEDQGWQPRGSRLTHAFTRQTTPAFFLSQMRDRVWSSCWRYSDDELARGTAAMEAAAPSQYGGLETALSVTITVHVQAYLPPAG